MVYLVQHIQRLKESLEPTNLASLAYFFVRNKQALAHVHIGDFNRQEQIAVKGYLSLLLTDEEKKRIDAPAYKGVDIASTIYKIIGAYLAAPGQVNRKLEQKFLETTIKNKFLISRCIPDYRVMFLDYLKREESEEGLLFKLIEGLIVPAQVHSVKVSEYLSVATDAIDLLVLEELQEKLIQINFSSTTINNVSVSDTIINVLNNFHNSVKKITQHRRKDHILFPINDEYDVQDLLYVILKSVFPELREEDPTPEVGGKSNKIDLILRNEGILLEVKMIKQKDSSEREFVEQLKNDIQSYYQCRWLKHMICFVYDPFAKTRDVHHFYDLNGAQTIKETTFTVKVIVNPV